jgi:hypothetical protein
MGSYAINPPPMVGTTCSIIKTGPGEYVIAGDKTLLRDVFENDPEQWLRCLALKEDNNG